MKNRSILVLCVLAGILLALVAGCNLTRPATEAGPIPTATLHLPAAPSNMDGAETILIPGGTFWMGSAEDDPDAGEDEQPRHQVTLDGYYLYTHEVTNAMYAVCVNAGACTPVQIMESGPSVHSDDPAYSEYPVVGVDWNMADDYCTWAGGRLPSEAEWEFAARAEESLVYPWGAEAPGCDRVNMFGCFVPPDTVPVGNYLLGNSPFEIWDLAGNVWEWVRDWYDADYYALSPVRAPYGPYGPEDYNDPLKVVRGGGLYSEPSALRSANRSGANPLRAFDDVGFRCVAEGETLPPSGMIPVPEGHELVPPDPLDGGGEHVEDPEVPEFWDRMGQSSATCPDAAGNITIYAEAESSESGEYSVTVEEIPFTCTYDDVLHLLTCSGPKPAVTEYPGVYHVKIYFPGGGLIGHQYPEIPEDCPPGGWPALSVSATATCPGEDGLVTLSIVSNPAITWEQTFYGEGMLNVEMPCWPVSENEMRCTVPARAPGEFYTLSLHGFTASGLEVHWWPLATIPADCPAGATFMNASPFCFEGQPFVHVNYGPLGTAFASASTIGIPLDCIGMTPVDQYCGVLPGTPGSSSTVTTCLAGGPCVDWDISVPDCSGPVDWYFDEVTSGCYPGLGPVAVIHYTPADLPLVAANANGLDLTCYDATEPGWYMCSGIPGSPGSEMTISFCLSNGTCFSEPITVQDCSTDASEAWRLIGVGCHDDTHIYVAIDTYIDFRGTGTPFTYTATDGDGTVYTCDLHPTVAGRFYCSGLRPESPGSLEFCIQTPGEIEPTCQSFPEFDIWLNETPPCLTIPAEPVDPCAVHTDEISCNLDKPACRWIYTEPQHCETNP